MFLYPFILWLDFVLSGINEMKKNFLMQFVRFFIWVFIVFVRLLLFVLMIKMRLFLIDLRIKQPFSSLFFSKIKNKQKM